MKNEQKALLKYYINKQGYTNKTFCERLGIPQQSFYIMLKNNNRTRLEILKEIKKILNLSAEEMEKIFFE